MSTKQQQIRAALDVRLAAFTPAWPTDWEGENFAPTDGVAYQSVRLLPRAPDNPTLSERLRDDGGVYQIGLYFPRGTPTGVMDARAGALQSYFYAGLTLTNGTIRVRVEGTPAIAAGLPTGDRWLVPVSIRYRCLT